jgi:RNA polymerase-binding transcription factor DksA
VNDLRGRRDIAVAGFDSWSMWATVSAFRSVSTSPDHSQAQAQRTTEQDDRVEIADRERALLAEVERALDKLRAGTYGRDEWTGQRIPYDRLIAIPWARRAADEDGASLAP